MEHVENLEINQTYTYIKAAAVTSAVVYLATGPMAAAVTAVGLSILLASQMLTNAFQTESIISYNLVKLTLSAALATISAVAYLSIGGFPLVASEVAYIASLFLIPTLVEVSIETVLTLTIGVTYVASIAAKLLTFPFRLAGWT